ncbi:methionine synthase [Tissierella sp. MSJ-40]|uniref:Methionine synthase n=1 Tax=Tissierella simiarum TaxID=2841534 RepID=A0ABS6E7M8_9FIRM|nr:methionine synthase [Tissierella simiarum]MBU5438907.1 methionine synthase [Tissierella simiarum]
MLYINKKEVLRYLGYKNQILDQTTKILIEECIDEIRHLVSKRYIYRILDISRKESKIILSQYILELEGKDINRHLEGAESCVLMAVTLGNYVDTRIRYYEKFDMTKALILDACATTAVEQVCDEACEEIESKVNQQGKKLTPRYSPGYGDLPIEIQQKFISILEADKTIGLTTSSHNILIPRKSVTAIMGIVDENQKIEKRTCLNCNKFSDCIARKEGVSCGN